MSLIPFAVVLVLVSALSVSAQEVTFRKDVEPILKKYCGDCHSPEAGSPSLAEFKANPDRQEQYKKDALGPRIDTYESLLQLIVWPDTGAFMRRMDDGSSRYAGAKPGNMYSKLCDKGHDAQCAANLKLLKAWVGEGAWNLNRWTAGDGVPGITKEQLDKLKLKY